MLNTKKEDFLVDLDEELEKDIEALYEVDKDSLDKKIVKSECKIIDLNKYKKGDFYLNNQNLLKQNKFLKYSKEQIIEIDYCINNIYGFLIKHTKIIHPDDGLIPFSLRNYQIELIEKMNKYNRLLNLQSRQSGKTTAFAGYILHYIVFNSHKRVAILANKGDKAREILKRIKEMYMQLPLWLQPGVKIWNKGSIELGNGTKVIAESTSATAARGDTLNCITGNSFITIRNKKTKKTEKIHISELKIRLEKKLNNLSNGYEKWIIG